MTSLRREITNNHRENLRGKPYRVYHHTFNSITMKAVGVSPEGQFCRLRGTYALGGLTWYDYTNRRWADKWDFTFQTIS